MKQIILIIPSLIILSACEKVAVSAVIATGVLKEANKNYGSKATEIKAAK
tara:strand:+ start:14 stop:163 length:150 start_codon:yes stop_codon:yes gene_type:complete